MVMKLQPRPAPWGAASAVIPTMGAISDWNSLASAASAGGAGEGDG
jgi:hypothetical protein